MAGLAGLALPLRHVAAAEPPPAASADFEEDWQVIYLGTVRIGYAHMAEEKRMHDGKPVIATDLEMVMVISRFGQSVKIRTLTRSLETPTGELLTIDHTLQNPPAAPNSMRGVVADGKLTLELNTGGKLTRKELPWDESIKAPAYQSRILREHRLKPGDELSFKTFDPTPNDVISLKFKAVAMETVALLGGVEKELLKVNVTNSFTPTIPSIEYIDAAGDALKTTSALGGLTLTIYKVAKAEALAELKGEEVDFGVTTLVRLPPIPNARRTQRVVYRITTPGEDPAHVFATGGTQQMKPAGPQAIDLTVQALAPGAAGGEGPPGREFTIPSRLIQSDDEAVKNAAARAVGDETDPWKNAVAMEQWVYKNLRKKNFSTLLASAAEVARTLSGDCTEHAVLLAGMARARGIPSRVVVGLVYVEDRNRGAAFGGHMWTELFINGLWRPLDATLGQGGIAADHIKMSDSSLADAAAAPLAAFLPMLSVLGKMKIEVRESSAEVPPTK